MDNGERVDTNSIEPSGRKPTAETETSRQGDENGEAKTQQPYPFLNSKVWHVGCHRPRAQRGTSCCAGASSAALRGGECFRLLALFPRTPRDVIIAIAYNSVFGRKPNVHLHSQLHNHMLTERCVIRDHHGISDPESDSPLPVFLLYLWASRCNLVGIQPIQSRLRLGCIEALPR